MRFVLASSSPARLESLRRAGVLAAVHPPDVDEGDVAAPTTAQLVSDLARLKGRSVIGNLPYAEAVVVACDSLLELDGEPVGKPGSPEAAASVWRRLRGRQGVLWTGHHVTVVRPGATRTLESAVGTDVWFAQITDAEIDAYVATGEPTHVAGAFTIDGFGAAFIERIAGDPHNVIGISLPTVRKMLADLDVPWPSLWEPCGHCPGMP